MWLPLATVIHARSEGNSDGRGSWRGKERDKGVGLRVLASAGYGKVGSKGEGQPAGLEAWLMFRGPWLGREGHGTEGDDK